MPLEILADPDDRIIRVRATGAGDASEWARLTEARNRSGDTRRLGLLMDVRPRESFPDADGARSIGALMSRWHAVAIVTQPGAQFGVARMVDIIGGMDGTPVQSFTDLDEARSWLSGRLPPPGRMVPAPNQ